MTFELSKVEQPQVVSAKKLNKNTTNQTPTDIGIGKSDISPRVRATLEFLGITHDEYLQYCKIDPEFANRSDFENKRILDARRQALEEVQQDLVDEENEIEDAEQYPEFDEESVDLLDDTTRTESYNFAEFEAIESKEEKINIISYEIARNKYLYGNKDAEHSVEEWENLSDAEKEILIQAEKDEMYAAIEERKEKRAQATQNSKIESVNEDITNNVNNYYTRKLESILIANWLGVSIDYYSNRTMDEKISYFNEALSNSENLTQSQKDRIQENKDLTVAWGYFLATEGDEPDNGIWKAKTEFNIESPLDISCLKEKIAEYNEKIAKYNETAEPENKKRENITISDIKEMYMKYQLDNNLVPEEKLKDFKEQYQKIAEYNQSNLRKLTELKNIGELIESENIKLAEPPVLAELEEKYGFSIDLSQKEKRKIVNQYLDARLKEAGSQEEKADILTSAMYELLAQSPDNGFLVSGLHRMALRTGGEEFQNELSARYELVLQAANALNAKEYENNKKATENIQKGQEQLKESDDPELQLLADNLAVETMNNATDQQNVWLSDTYSAWEAQSVQEKHADKAIEILSRNKEFGQEMLTNASVNSSEETLVYLANNIKNIDASLQQEALDAVYASGNEKAIDVAVDNIISSPQVIQQAEFSRTFAESAIKTISDESSEIASLDFSKRLTSEQIASLTPAERRNYFAKLFIKASASDKIRILEKMPDGTRKKTLYTVIARFVPRLLDNMIDSGMGPQMLSINLPLDASNKVLKSMINSENPEVKKQVAELRKDKAYDERMENFENQILVKASEEKNVHLVQGNMSVPQDFGLKEPEKKYIYKKDGNGNLMA